MYTKPFISFYDYTTSRQITQEKKEKIDKKIKHFKCLHQFYIFKSVKLPIIGKLIPAGTGMAKYKDIHINTEVADIENKEA